MSLQRSFYSGKVRVRVCGLHVTDQGILLIKHQNIGVGGFLWSPPGGGVMFGEKVEDVLIREFKEETNLTVKVGEYLFTNEYIDERHHALELFFRIKSVDGNLKLGSDPEMPQSEQIMKELRYLSFVEVNRLPIIHKHNAFNSVESSEEIINLKGFLRNSVI